jgi:PKD repeat protein
MAEIRIAANPSTGIKPLTVSFTAEIVSGTFISFSWDFGDGETSSVKDPTHVYNTTGYHTVVLVARDNGLVDHTVIERALIRIGELSFTTEYDADSGTPVSAYFTNTSSAPTGYEFRDWSWEFGDASLGSGATGPSHIYTEYGNYNVTLGAKMQQL